MPKQKTFRTPTMASKARSFSQTTQAPEQTDAVEHEPDQELTGNTPLAERPLNSNNLMLLQRSIGNQAVMRMIKNARPPRIEPTPARARPRPHIISRKTADKVVQRAPGLPNKKEAITQGGKSGWKLKGKTSYGLILEDLDQFRAAGVTDKKGQAAILESLLEHTTSWLDSATRKKNKKGDPKKTEFISQLRPMVKVLHSETTARSQVIQPIEQNASDNAGKNMIRIRFQLLQDRINLNQGQIKNMLSTLQAANLTTNLAFKTLDFYLASPEYKTSWMLADKTKSPGGVLPTFDNASYSQKRELAERYIGYSPFTENQRQTRPAYAGVNVLNNPKGAAPTYGPIYFIWNDAVKQRCTYTARDTFAMIGDGDIKDLPKEETIASSANMEAILAHNEKLLKYMALLEMDMTAEAAELKKSMGKYVEAQVHGGLSIYDAESLVIPYNKDTTDPIELMDLDFVKRFSAKYPHVKIVYRG